MDYYLEPDIYTAITTIACIAAALVMVVFILNELRHKKPWPKSISYYMHLFLRSFIKTALVIMVCGLVSTILGFFFFMLIFSR